MFNRCNTRPWPTLVLEEEHLYDDGILVFVAPGSTYAVICCQCIYLDIILCIPSGKHLTA